LLIYSIDKKIQEKKFLLPASDQLNADAPITLNNLKVDWTQAVFYKTVMSDLSDLLMFIMTY
jgi:uroporphyrinogen-III synthase